MSGVDVLAELDRRISISRELCVVRDITETPPGLADLVEARDAVADLIEAASAGSVMDASGRQALWLGPEKAERLRAALARCRGGES